MAKGPIQAQDSAFFRISASGWRVSHPRPPAIARKRVNKRAGPKWLRTMRSPQTIEMAPSRENCRILYRREDFEQENRLGPADPIHGCPEIRDHWRIVWRPFEDRLETGWDFVKGSV